MSYRHFSILTAVILTVSFCLFLVGYEKHALIQAQARIETHARIIEDAMWNYNHLGASEYLALAANTDNYEAMTVTHHNGEIFQAIQQDPPGSFEGLLIGLHLIPRVPLLAQVEYKGNIIGWVEATWLPRSIYVHAYIFFAAVMVYIVIFLYLRVLKAKKVLEDRVQERTAELSSSNRALKREIDDHAIAEAALRTSEEKHRLLAANITDVIWTMDLEMNFTYISPVATKMQGWDPEEIDTLTLASQISADSIEMVAKILADNLAEGEKSGNYNRSVTLEIDLFRKDGTTFPDGSDGVFRPRR